MFSKKNAQPNQSIIDGITCLQALAAEPGPVAMTDLARQLGIERTRMNRILKTLAYLGLAVQTVGRKYRCGPAIHILAAQSLFASGLLQCAFPLLNNLRANVGKTVALGMLWRDKVSYLYHAAPLVAESPIARVGSYPATQSGIGMALMATQPDEVIHQIYGPMTDIPGPYANVDQLLAHIQRIRVNGHAFIPSATVELTSTMAVTIGSPAYCAIGIADLRDSDDIDSCLRLLRETARQIEQTAY